MNIESLKKSIQIFSRKTATSINWPPVEKDIECAIDEVIVECDKMNSTPYTGVPAPILNKPDNWFTPLSSEFMTEKQKIYKMEQEEILDESDDIESVKNIHQRMYEMSIKSGKTTLHLNNGGSENVHR